MLGKRIINTATGAAPSACTTDTVQILDGAPFESIATYQLDGNANDLTTNYNGTWSGTEAYTTGQFGQAAVFDGVSSVLSVPRSFSANSAYSVSAWMKMPSSGFTFLCLFWQNVGTNEIGLFYEGDIDRIVLRHKFQTNSDVTYTFPSRPNGWNHYAATFNGSNLGTIYFNGVPIASGALDPKGDISNTVYIGGGYTYNYNTYYREGEFDQVRFFNTALSAGAVTNLYNETVATASNTYINTPSLVAYYKMSDATDETGSYDGTPSNVNFNVAGKFGNAGEFNGSSSKVVLGSLNQFSGNNVSFSLWFNSTNVSTTKILLGSNVNAIFAGELDLYTYNSGFLLTVATASNAYKQWTTPANLSSNTWHNVVVTLDSGTSEVAKIYLDGIEQNKTILGQSGTISGALLNSASNLNLGVDNVPASYFNGKIDQVRIFNRAITSEEVETLYNEVQCVPDIVPASNFNTVLYTGNSTNDQSITGVGFQPDFVWIKSRNVTSSGTSYHGLWDSVRGTGGHLYSSVTNQETNTPNRLYSFDSDGFSLGNGVDPEYIGDRDYVAWCWKAGGDDVLNEEGSIDSQVSANPDAGFSIVKYTGGALISNTVGHGLSKAPELIIQKTTNTTRNWNVYNVDFGASKNLHLNLTDTVNTDEYWSVNSSTFAIQDQTASYDRIAYCFHSVDGMSKVGSYKGTGAVGNNIVTGFRPAFVMVKSSSNAEPWFILDNKRDPNNPRDNRLMADSTAAESDGSVHTMDFNSNGFTLNGTVGNGTNGSGVSYIFLAIAEEAFNPNGVTRNTTDPFGDGSEVALYKFEDNANDAEDNYDGADTNVTYSAGYIDKAAVFDGSSSIIYVNSFDTTTNFSISLWFKTSSSNYQVLANNGGGEGTNTGFLWYLNTSGNIVLATSSGGGNFNGTPTTSAYNDGNWHNAVLSYASNGVYSIYVDNQLVVSETSSRYTGALVFGRPFAIGAWTQLNQWWFNGSIDQVRIFDRALDSGEVEQLYNE